MMKPAIPIAASREEAERLIGRIGDLNRQKTREGLAYGQKIAGLKQAYEEKVATLDREIEEAEAKVRGWCVVNRNAICPAGKKSAKFATGVVKFRTGRLRVVIADAEKALARIKEMGLTRFIRQKEEINQQALLAEPDVAETIPGVTIERAPEEIVVEPIIRD